VAILEPDELTAALLTAVCAARQIETLRLEDWAELWRQCSAGRIGTLVYAPLPYAGCHAGLHELAAAFPGLSILYTPALPPVSPLPPESSAQVHILVKPYAAAELLRLLGRPAGPGR
jgi:hypothetical protein